MTKKYVMAVANRSAIKIYTEEAENPTKSRHEKLTKLIYYENHQNYSITLGGSVIYKLELYCKFF